MSKAKTKKPMVVWFVTNKCGALITHPLTRKRAVEVAKHKMERGPYPPYRVVPQRKGK